MVLPRVVTTLHLPPPQLALLREHAEVILPKSHWPIPKEELLELVPGAQGILCTSSDKVDDALLQAAGPQLRIVSTMSAGYDHIDLDAVRGKVSLGHTANALTDSVAEVNIGLALALLRGLTKDDVRTGAWEEKKVKDLFLNLGESLVGKTCGFLGLGKIGLATAHRLLPFGISKLIYTNRNPTALALQVGAQHVTLDELAAESDLLFVCASLNPTTEGIVSRSLLSKMRPTTCIINTSRGGLVDQEALVEALEEGRIGGAGLDVMTPEPLSKDHRLARCPNVVLTPHIGSATTAARTGMANSAVENLLAGLKGLELPEPIIG